MKNLFDAAIVDEIEERISQLRPDSARLWGTMNPGAGPRTLLGRVGVGGRGQDSAAHVRGTIDGTNREAAGAWQRRADAPQLAHFKGPCDRG